MECVVPDILWRSSRPGYGLTDVGGDQVAKWIEDAQACGVRTILCLLNEEQLAYYGRVPGGLLGAYRHAGFAVVHRAVEDHLRPPMPPVLLDRIASDFLTSRLPMLVHCSAGIDRTGAVVRHLVEGHALPGFRTGVEELMAENRHIRGEDHFRQVTRLALDLYDGLEALLELAPRYRTVLWAAAMLHDIGTVRAEGRAHPWHSGMMILAAAKRLAGAGDLATVEEIATVAALHKGAGADRESPLGPIEPPIDDLWRNQDVPAELQKTVAILRVADGLDRSLEQFVNSVEVDAKAKRILAHTAKPANDDVRRAREKSILLNAVTGRVWHIEPHDA